jgi:hypothetical protein
VKYSEMQVKGEGIWRSQSGEGFNATTNNQQPTTNNPAAE